MENSLKDLLDDVLSSYDARPMSGLEKAILGPSWKKLKIGEDFLEAVKAKQEFKTFDECLQMLGNSAASTKIIELADWIIERANKVGSEQALKDVNKYLSSSEVEVYELMLLASLHIDAEHEFCNGVKLIQPQSIPNEYLATRIIRDSINSILPLPRVESALIIPYKQTKFHVRNTEDNIKFPRPKIPYEALEDVMLCLGLVRPIGYGIQVIGHGTLAPDDLPFIQSISGWGITPFKQPPLAPPLLEIEMRNADTILNKFKELPKSLKEKLIISIGKLNGYSSGASLVEKAIDLRICLESIFLSDGNKEQLRYTLSLRAALFLGNSFDERKDIIKLVKDAYDVTSTAVHTGKLPRKKVELLPKAAELAKKAIIKLIEEGDANWQKIELMGQ